MYRFDLLILSACLVAGSALAAGAPGSTETASLRNRKACCKSFKEIKYESLDDDSMVQFKLDSSSRVYRFRSGKSYFRAFRLPAYTRPYRINVKSYIVRRRGRNGRVLIKPVFMFLDKRFRKTRIAQITPQPKNVEQENVELDGYVEIKAQNSKDRYLLLYTTSEMTKDSFKYRKPHVLIPVHVGSSTTVITMKERVYPVPFGYQGKISLSISYP